MATSVNELILISVDDHVIEPRDLFRDHVPKKYRDEAPRLERKADGTDVWIYEGVELPTVALSATAGRPPEEYGVEPLSLDEVRRGTYDIHARVRDMDANGVLASMCFPSFPQFCGQLFARTKDYETGLAMTKAYNDWHIDEWCGSYPGRFIPLALPGLINPEDMAAEVRRVAGKGCHAVTFSENPAKLGLPSYHSDHWDPFWKACEESGTIVCLHIGSSSAMPITADDAPMDVSIVLTPMNLFMAAADILYSPVLRKFPTLKFALSEGGIGWIPYFLERTDWSWERQRHWTKSDFGGARPSEVFRERFVTCFIDDKIGLKLRNEVGIDSITWECDYPHSDSTWPRSPEMLAESFAGLSDQDIAKVTHENAMRFFRFDPFAYRAREQCTVGALRAGAADWDISVKSFGTRSRVPAAGTSSRPIAPAIRT
jgi:predicted TIM-barrel fold metal-dependent hydrolase